MIIIISLMLQTIRYNVFKSCWQHRYMNYETQAPVVETFSIAFENIAHLYC